MPPSDFDRFLVKTLIHVSDALTAGIALGLAVVFGAPAIYLIMAWWRWWLA